MSNTLTDEEQLEFDTLLQQEMEGREAVEEPPREPEPLRPGLISLMERGRRYNP